MKTQRIFWTASLLLLVLVVPSVVLAQTHGPIYDHFYKPLNGLVPRIFKVVWALILLLSIVYGFRAYKKMQMGEEDASLYMIRWGAALLGVIGVVGFMGAYYKNDVSNNAFYVDYRLYMNIDEMSGVGYTPPTPPSSLTNLPTIPAPTTTPPPSNPIGPNP